MRVAHLAILVIAVGVLLVGKAPAQDANGLRQSVSGQQDVIPREGYISYAPQADIGASASPSDQAPPAPGQPAAKPAVSGGTAAAEAKPEEKKEEEKKDEEKKDEGPEAFKLFKGPLLDCWHVDIRGWIDQGVTLNADSPTNRFNGPVGYNDRSNEYEMNQLYLITERVTKVENGCGMDWGGRMDLLYGTDRRFPAAYELDSEWNLGQRFYGLVMPQLYGDLAVNNWIFRGGHFLAPCGEESVMAVENFFYSHTYGFLYGQPTTLSGGQAMYKLSDRWTFNAGIDTGWNDWIAPNGKINYFFGANWNSEDGKTTIANETFIGNTQPEQIDSTRFHNCLVLTQKIGEKWNYAFENNYAYETNTFGHNGAHTDWLGFANYFFYDINDCWKFGIRHEFFLDDDAAVVAIVGPTGPDTFAGPFLGGHYNDLSLGLNYKPNKNLVVRSEVRWDISATNEPVGMRPFDDGKKNDQFLWATDLIVKF
ncbi:MAG: outer membrane beta-barrel protein [Thermoguttaceae bacterium]|jgi:hypothetical protein